MLAPHWCDQNGLVQWRGEKWGQWRWWVGDVWVASHTFYSSWEGQYERCSFLYKPDLSGILPTRFIMFPGKPPYDEKKSTVTGDSVFLVQMNWHLEGRQSTWCRSFHFDLGWNHFFLLSRYLFFLVNFAVFLTLLLSMNRANNSFLLVHRH